MSDEAQKIDCECHGKGVAAVVCGHLINNNGAPLGFIENSSDPDDLQGWCYACENVFLQENDKTNKFRAFTNMSMICDKCYAEI